MTGLPITPIDAGAVPDVGRHFFDGGMPYDVTVVATFRCAGCGKPHLIRVASSVKTPESTVNVLSLGILDIIDTYSIIPDDEHTSWRHNASE